MMGHGDRGSWERVTNCESGDPPSFAAAGTRSEGERAETNSAATKGGGAEEFELVIGEHLEG
jgi:hypothetical protein